MQFFKQNTVVTISIGPCMDSTGVEYTGLVISDLTLTKNGVSSAMAAAATLTATSNGFYDLVTIAGNTDTPGRLKIRCNKATYQIPVFEGMVLPATVYDVWVTNPTTAVGGLGDIQRMAGVGLTGRDIGASVLLSAGTGAGQLDFTNGVVKGNLVQILATALTETVGGYIAAAFKKLYDIAVPVFTAASVNQTGDSYGRIGANGAGLTALGDARLANLDATTSSVINAIAGLNNLSALVNLFGSPVLEIPDSGTTQFPYMLVVRDNEGKMVDLDANPTITAANGAGTDRSANLSVVAHPATGRYTFTYGVASAAAEEGLRITASGTVSAEARYVEIIGGVVNYDTLTQIAAIQTSLASVATAAALTTLSNKVGTPAGASIAADIAAGTTQAATAATQATEAATQATKAADLIDSDEYTEQAGPLFQRVRKRKGTATELSRHTYKKLDNTDLTSVNDIPAHLVAP
jgi:hypothetical protein